MKFAAREWARTIKTGSPSLKAVLKALADHADEHGVCWPSQKTIAAEAELTDRTVRTALGALEERGFLSRESQFDKAHRRQVDRIVLAIHRKDFPLVSEPPETVSARFLEKPPEGISGSLGNRPEGISAGKDERPEILSAGNGPEPAEILSKSDRKEFPTELLRDELKKEKKEEGKKEKQKETRVDALCVLSTDFELFWSIYPNKTKRLSAEKAFAKIQENPNLSFSDILEGLKAYATKTDDRHWCNPDTWLKEHRWLDKPATVERTNAKPGWFERLRQSEEAGNERLRAMGLSENGSSDGELPHQPIYPRLSRPG